MVRDECSIRVPGLLLVLVVAMIVGTRAQADSKDDWARMEAIVPKGYVCGRCETPPQIDGRHDDAAWQSAPWTDEFVDIEGDPRPRPRFKTRAKMLWDDAYFYIAAQIEEPHVWGTLTEHDSVIFHDNDFEVFVDPDGDNHEYYEFEINALGTGWDLFLPRPYKDGGYAENRWEMPGLLTAIDVEGTLNDPTDRDTGWSVEIAMPWAALREYAHRPAPPRDGDQWRVNFSRVEWQAEIEDGKYRKVPDTREDNWVWSPQGIVDMHRPERWGSVQFSTARPGEATFRPDPAMDARNALLEVYHHQKAFHEKHGRWADNLNDLGVKLAVPVRLLSKDGRFRATIDIAGEGGQTAWSIRHDSRLRPAGREDDLTDQLEAILDRQVNAWNRGGLDEFMDYYWKSDDLSFSSGGRTTRGWAPTKARYLDRYPTNERMGRLSFGAIEVKSLGDSAALMLGRWNLEREPAPIGGNFTLVFIRVEGRWVIAHDHTSQAQ